MNSVARKCCPRGGIFSSDRSKCITTFKKWLSFDEIMGNMLCFDKTWSSYALPKTDGKLTIVDEYGNSLPCYFHLHVGDTNKSGNVKGWSTFCRNKKLFQDQGVKFGVFRTNSNIIYFTPSC